MPCLTWHATAVCYNFSAMNPPADDLRLFAGAPSAIEESIGGGHLALFTALKELSNSSGIPIHLVGGPVRDWLMGWQIRDLDFVVEGDAPSLARVLAQRVHGRAIVHSRFRTARVELDGAGIDLVTARKEVYSNPGSLPVVEPSSLRDDLSRRDFTINAMALPLDGDVEGLVDPFDGRNDLLYGIVRTLDAQSFRDDPTRLFRAARYEQRLDFTLSQETLEQFLAEVDSRGCDNVSGDRLRHEVDLIFREQHPEKALVRATELGLLSSIVPGLGQREWVARWAGSKEAYEAELGAEWRPWLAVLAYPFSQADGEALVRRLNMPRRWAEVVRSSIELRSMETILADAGLPLSALVRLLGRHDAKTIRIVSSICDSPDMARNLNRYLESEDNLKPALKGGDLLELGVPSGPLVGKALADLRDLRLDRRISSEEEERRWVKGLVASRICTGGYG